LKSKILLSKPKENFEYSNERGYHTETEFLWKDTYGSHQFEILLACNGKDSNIRQQLKIETIQISTKSYQGFQTFIHIKAHGNISELLLHGLPQLIETAIIDLGIDITSPNYAFLQNLLINNLQPEFELIEQGNFHDDSRLEVYNKSFHGTPIQVSIYKKVLLGIVKHARKAYLN